MEKCGGKMQRNFDDEQIPIAISIPDDSLISTHSCEYHHCHDHEPPPEDCCEEHAFCLYPIVQTVIGLVNLGAFYMQWRLVKVNNELKPEPLLTFPGHKIVFFSFLLSIIFQEAFLWLERDSRKTALFATLSYICTIFVISLVWFYQEQHGREYDGELGLKIRALLVFVLWILFLVISIAYVIRLTRLTFLLTQNERR